jgi:hypothetical protein
LRALWSVREGSSGSGPKLLGVLAGHDVFPAHEAVRRHLIRIVSTLEAEEM